MGRGGSKAMLRAGQKQSQSAKVGERMVTRGGEVCIRIRYTGRRAPAGRGKVRYAGDGIEGRLRTKVWRNGRSEDGKPSRPTGRWTGVVVPH